MYAYRTPGVYFEWLDTRQPGLSPVRTDVAGFVGIAARGPLHRPVKVESWSQFVSAFGAHIPQGLLAYAVEGFFANGGRTCWVVRIADPDLARPAWLDLLDEDGVPALRLFAASPGTWGRQLGVSVVPGAPTIVDGVGPVNGQHRFSLVLRLDGGGREVWSDLSMQPGDRRYFETVINHLETGSRLALIAQAGAGLEQWNHLYRRATDPRYAQQAADPSQAEPPLLTIDEAGPMLARSDKPPRPFATAIRAVELADGAGRPALRLEPPGTGPLRAGWGSQATLTVRHTAVGRFSLRLHVPQAGQETWPDLTLDPDDPRYAVTLLNDPAAGSRLMRAHDLGSTTPYPWNRPRRGTVRLCAPDLRAGSGHLAGGSDGLAPRLDLNDKCGEPALRLVASGSRVRQEGIEVCVASAGRGRFALAARAEDGATEAFDDLTMSPTALDLLDRTGQATLRLSALGHGEWDRQIAIGIAPGGGSRFSLKVHAPGGREQEWADLTMDRCDARYAVDVINDPQTGSRWVFAQDLGSSAPAPLNTPDPLAPPLQAGRAPLIPDPRYVERVLNDPQDGSRLVRAYDLDSPSRYPHNAPQPQTRMLRGGLRPTHWSGQNAPLDKEWGLNCLAKAQDLSIVAMPGLLHEPAAPVLHEPRPRCDVPEVQPALPPADPEFAPELSAAQVQEIQRALILHCEQLKDRVAILDPPLQLARPNVALENLFAWRDRFRSKYAAAYYPWLRVPDPLREAGRLRDMPPSGHVAGLYARVDLQVGVHKPPANEVLEIVRDVSVAVDDLWHGELNQRGVNVIRVYPGRGVRVAGARTTFWGGEWRYVNVRRLLIMIERAIDEQLQWLVFEPNRPHLWRDVTRIVAGFLDRLWRRGMLDGATAEEAYHVRCDETTNPPQETDLGRLICEIGVRPPWPAEFVIVRIGITDGGTQVLEAAS